MTTLPMDFICRKGPPRLCKLAGLFIFLTGCRQDMQDQPKFYPQRGTTFFASGRSVLDQPNGTVARSQGATDGYFRTGMESGKEADGLPIPLTLPTLQRGQERFNIFCSPCHSRVGNGKGMIVERGYHPATSLHSTRLRDAPLGHFFAVMTNGYGTMPNYAVELAPEERWAVAAYIRALQLSQNAKPMDAEISHRTLPLSQIARSQGISSSFLDPWFPPAKARMTSLAPVVPAPRASTIDSSRSVSASTEALRNSSASGGISGSVSSQKPKNGSTRIDPPQVIAGNNPHGAILPDAQENSTPAAPATVPNAVAGKALYLQKCSGCHQPSRAGLPPMIPALLGIVPKVGADRIRTVVAEGIPAGKPPMPSFPELTADDVDNLIAYLKTN